jgi:hypothetical protein
MNYDKVFVSTDSSCPKMKLCDYRLPGEIQSSSSNCARAHCRADPSGSPEGDIVATIAGWSGASKTLEPRVAQLARKVLRNQC